MRVCVVHTILHILVLSMLIAHPEAATIKGRMTDSWAGEPLPNVNVTVSERDVTVTSDQDGRYIIKHLNEGILTLLFTLVGYDTTLVVTNARDSQPVIIDVRMRKTVIKLLDTISVASPPEYLPLSEVRDFSRIYLCDKPARVMEPVLRECRRNAYGVEVDNVSSRLKWFNGDGGITLVRDYDRTYKFFELTWVDVRRERRQYLSLDASDASYPSAAQTILEGWLPYRFSVQSDQFINHFRYNCPRPVDTSLTLLLEIAPGLFDTSDYCVRVTVRARRDSSLRTGVGRLDVAQKIEFVVEFDTLGTRSYHVLGQEDTAVPDSGSCTATERDAARSEFTITTVIEVKPANPALGGPLGRVSLSFYDMKLQQRIEILKPVETQNAAPTFRNASPDLRLAFVAGRFGEYLAHPNWPAGRALNRLAAETRYVFEETGDGEVLSLLRIIMKTIYLRKKYRVR